MRHFVSVCAVGALLCLASPASAQREGPDGQLIYDAAFFATFSPANALQMIERLPGFVLDAGKTEIRGFAQAAGNVIINGRRPSSKSDTLSVVLQRIPASRVLRIELVAGNSLAAEYASMPQVANVVLTEEGGLAGTFEVKLAREFTGTVLPTASASLLLRRGESQFTAAARFQNFATNEEGYDRVTDYRTGVEREYRTRYRHSREPFKTGALGWAYEPAADNSAHINAKYSVDPWDIDQNSDLRFASGARRHELFTQRHIWKIYELSGDVTRPFAGGALKLNLLATRRDRAMTDSSVQSDAASFFGGISQTINDRRDERVARLSWTRAGLAGWSLETGGEAAMNRLRSRTDFFNISAANVATRVDLPIDNAVVTEYRGELFANAGRDLAKTLRIDLAVTYEASRLSVTGDVHARRTLHFVKPRASLDWRPGKWHAQLSLTRSVAQLDFAEFVSGADINENRLNGGNAQLVPQRAWELLFTADRKILGDGRVRIELGHDRVAKVQDRVPVGAGLDAPGNLGPGTRWIARTNIDLPLGRLGLKGGRLSLYGSYVDTSVRDPYTLRARHFSGVQLFVYTASLRQDLGRFAWGIDLKGNTGSTSFRRAELDELQGVSPAMSAFVEYRPTPRFIATLGVDNVRDASARRWRSLYLVDRTPPAVPDAIEYRHRSQHQLWHVTLKRTFG